jgi:hypothetical protein
MVGIVATAGAPLTTIPAGVAGDVAPNPVAHRIKMSPAFAATVPDTADGLPMSALSGYRVAIAYVLKEYWKNAGEVACKVAGKGWLGAPLFVTTTFTVPKFGSVGACTLIWFVLT